MHNILTPLRSLYRIAEHWDVMVLQCLITPFGNLSEVWLLRAGLRQDSVSGWTEQRTCCPSIFMIARDEQICNLDFHY